MIMVQQHFQLNNELPQSLKSQWSYNLRSICPEGYGVVLSTTYGSSVLLLLHPLILTTYMFPTPTDAGATSDVRAVEITEGK